MCSSRPLDITNIQPTSLDSTSSQNLCDVIHQLHGDQQQERSLQKLSSRDLQINARKQELSNLQQSKHILSSSKHLELVLLSAFSTKGHRFNSEPVHSDTVSSLARCRCDVSSKQCFQGTKYSGDGPRNTLHASA